MENQLFLYFILTLLCVLATFSILVTALIKTNKQVNYLTEELEKLKNNVC